MSILRTNMESSLDEGLSPVTDVNLALITRLILHIADTQLPVRMGNIWNYFYIVFSGQHTGATAWTG